MSLLRLVLKDIAASVLDSLFPSLSDHLLWRKPDTMLGAALWIGPRGEEQKAPANSHVNELRADPKTWILSMDPKADPSRQFYQGFLILWNCERGFKLLIFRAVRYAKSRQLNTGEALLHSLLITIMLPGFSGGSDSKESAHSARDPGSIPAWGRSPGEGHGNPLQYSCLENPMDRGAWQATVHLFWVRRDWATKLSLSGTHSFLAHYSCVYLIEKHCREMLICLSIND